MKKEIGKYRREAKKASAQQTENVVQSNQEGVTEQNVDNESGLRELSERDATGSIREDEDGRQAGVVSGNENGSGEATLQADDGSVQNQESGTTGDDGRGSGTVSGRAAEVRNATDEQDAVQARNDVAAAQKAYDEELDRITQDFTDGKITEEQANELYLKAEEKLKEAQNSTQGDEGASSMSDEVDYQAAATQNEQVKRSLDELITEAKRAFKNAKNFRINRDNLIFTMPNGLEMTVNIKDQIILNAADEAKARKEHGLNEGGIVVEGYAKRLDKGALVALSRESGTGTAYHEAFHTVWDWVLNDKEKAAMLKHFKPIAEKMGVAVDEAMADGYRDWKLARQQHKGTIFGKLFQKIKDFIDSARAVLTSAENVNNVYRQIKSGKVWNRDAKGRFAEAENSEKQFLVTNKKITTNTQVPLIDITNVFPAGANELTVRKGIVGVLEGKEFKILESGGIGIIKRSDKKEHPADHLFRGDGGENSRANKNYIRQKSLNAIESVLNNAIYVEKHPDATHGTNTRYVDLYSAVMHKVEVDDPGNPGKKKEVYKIYPIRIQAREKDKGSGLFNAGKILYYNLTKRGALPRTLDVQQVTSLASGNTPTISVAGLLQNVKDMWKNNDED